MMMMMMMMIKAMMMMMKAMMMCICIRLTYTLMSNMLIERQFKHQKLLNEINKKKKIL